MSTFLIFGQLNDEMPVEYLGDWEGPDRGTVYSQVIHAIKNGVFQIDHNTIMNIVEVIDDPAYGYWGPNYDIEGLAFSDEEDEEYTSPDVGEPTIGNRII